MPITYPYTQYSGLWSLNSQINAQATSNWPVPPPPEYLYSWGRNNEGQLGLGDSTNRSSPTQVGTLTNWLVLAGSYRSSFAIKKDGTLWSWGSNNNGQLGLGNTTNYSSPKQIGSLTNWSAISGGYEFVAAIKTDGTLWAWGRGLNGPLGLGNTTNYSSPKQVGSLTNWYKL